MNVRWTARARRDRGAIEEYIARDSPQAAAKMDALFSEAVSRLAEHPYIGRVGEAPGTRELIPHESYRIVYEVAESTVFILAIVHTARRWPQDY